MAPLPLQSLPHRSEREHHDCDNNYPETKDEVVGVGRVVRVIGPVVDVEFPAGQLPEILNALHVDAEVMGETHAITLEVALHIGENVVRAISLKPTDGMRRGTEVRDTGAPISVPVGDVTKGHVWNVTGDVLNADPSTIEVTERWPIHRDPRPSMTLSPRPRCWRPVLRSLTC